MRNFLVGLLLGWLFTAWYYTQGDTARLLAADLWARVSAPTAAAHHAP